MSCSEVMYQAYYPYLYQRPGAAPPVSAHPVPRTGPFSSPFASAAHQYDRVSTRLFSRKNTVTLYYIVSNWERAALSIYDNKKMAIISVKINVFFIFISGLTSLLTAYKPVVFPDEYSFHSVV